MRRLETRLTPTLRGEFGSFWPDTTYAAALSRWAGSQPDKTAVVDGSRRLSYAQLDALVDRVAAGLAACGVGDSDVVSSQLPNVLESLVLCYATNRLGAIHNPIVPIYGAREIRFILA
ncbi:MAG: AMP-binding protein, partial [Actinomycetota bacterium]